MQNNRKSNVCMTEPGSSDAKIRKNKNLHYRWGLQWCKTIESQIFAWQSRTQIMQDKKKSKLCMTEPSSSHANHAKQAKPQTMQDRGEV